MKFQAHRGVGTEFPENTMPAFRAAAMQGYEYIELDPNVTADNQIVLLHDSTLNRTCRNADGSEIAEELPIARLTYEEALRYDAGIFKGEKHRGVKIPLLSEVLEFAKTHELTVKLDNKIHGFTSEQTEILYEIVERSGASVAFTCSQLTQIEKVVCRFPTAEIHYDGEVNEEILNKAQKLLRQNPLTVWLCLPSPLTDWVKIPKADEKLCALAKQYGKLGLWLLDTEEQLEQAKRYHADVIETTGRLKPCRTASGLYDCHTHTHHSHDGTAAPAESVRTAKKIGLAGLAFTDHCDNGSCKEVDTYTPVVHSVQSAELYPDFVMKGVEIGEHLWYPEDAERVLQITDYDIVLGSVHAARYAPLNDNYYSGIDFGKFTEGEIATYLTSYFHDLKDMVLHADFDVLTHLTCPLRYICGKFGRAVDLTPYAEKIDEILRLIIEKGIALEVNTSCVGSAYDELMPNEEILKRYKRLCGYLITLGSDAHRTDRIGWQFTRAAETLQELGFANLYYYQKRVPMQYTNEN